MTTTNNDSPEYLGSKYQLLELIGTGGMSEVYRCRLVGQKGFEKLIVVKKLLAGAAEDQEIVETFIDEARLAALLQHENIAEVYDFGELDGSFFIAMEYLNGKDLSGLIKATKSNKKTIPLEHALLICSKICAGMGYAHSLKDLQQRTLNLIHRDLSPHNVFITFEGKVKVIDFGIARAELFDHRTRAGVVKGKVSYMSPEQLTGDTIDHRSDIFSIGILLYEMISGTRMYTGDTATLIRKCIQADYTNLQALVPDLPSAIYKILDRALQRNPEKRYQHCMEMRSDLEDCLYTIAGRADSSILEQLMLKYFKQDSSASNHSLSSEKTAVVEYDKKEQAQLFKMARQGLNLSIFFHQKKIVLLSLAFCCVSFLGYSIYLPSKNITQSASEQTELSVTKEQVVTPLTIAKPVKKTQEEITVSTTQIQPEPVLPIPAPQSEPELAQDIEILLTQAEKALASNRLLFPKDDSAYSYYQRIAELDPQSKIVQDGIRKIVGRYAKYAKQSIDSDAFTEATEQIKKGLRVDGDSAKLLSLQQSLQLRKTRYIAEKLHLAQQAFGRDKLTSPASTSAQHYYNQIKEVDSNNHAAQTGLYAIGDRYTELATEAYINLNLNRTQRLIQKGLQVVPDHHGLLGLKKDLTRSKPGIFFDSLKKNFHQVFKITTSQQATKTSDNLSEVRN